MRGWKEATLTEITSKIGDGLHGTPTYDEAGDYYFVNGNNLSQGKIIIKSDTKKVNEDEFSKYQKPLSNNTILLGINGTIGNLAFFNGEKCVLGKSACYINVNEYVDKYFLYYNFLGIKFHNFLEGIATGTTIPNVPLKGLREYSLLLPPLPEQKAIATVLSSLDDKIDLLHRQNKTLEAMAETLFRQWFVEEAQEDWESRGLLDVVQLVGGGTPKTSVPDYWNGNIPWLAGGDIATNHKSFVNDSEKKITEDGLCNSSAKLLPQFATVISARGTVGKYCLLAGPMAFSQSNYGILPNIRECFFFTYLLINHVVEELQSSAYGSVFDTITTNTFKDIKMSLPDDPVIEEFEKGVVPFFQKILTNKGQIALLEKLRDTLLPKLMSGEVKVKV